MILKEIEMDLPYERNDGRIKALQATEGVDYDTAVRLDYERYWKEKRRNFQLSTRCMTAMVERLTDSILTDDCWKILIECVRTPVEGLVKNFLGVYVVQVQIDYDKYISSTDLEKKKFVIAKIVEAMNIVSRVKGMALEEVQNTCDLIQKKDYINEWIWGKTQKNKSRYVQIKVLHEVSEVSIFMIFTNNMKNVIKETKLISVVPDERVYSRYLGELKWLSDNESALITKDGEVFKCLV